MEKNNEIAQAEKSFHIKVNAPASAEDSVAFWAKLRNFYRTGEKAATGKEEKMTTALLSLLENDIHYPFQPDGENSASIEYGTDTHFRILNHLLTEHQKESRKKFKNQLSSLATGLNQLLKLEDKPTETKQWEDTYDFADAMIAFDKMVDIIPQKSKEVLSPERLNRLEAVVARINGGLNYFGDTVATLVLDKETKKQFEKNQLFGSSRLIEADKNPFSQIQALFNSETQTFTELIKAYRIAKLEVAGEYKEEIHKEYFEHFTWHRLLDEELNLIHPMVLVVGHHDLYEHLSAFSRLIASNQPVNIIVINNEMVSVPNNSISWEDAAHQFRQELAALAISHRNVFTFQASMDNPEFLYSGLANCLQSTAPGICHLSVAEDLSSVGIDGYLAAKAEVAGRYFPKITYDPSRGNKWAERFDLSGNTQEDAKWPMFTMSVINKEDKEQLIDVAFTYADYKAIYPEKVKELMLVPSEYYADSLIPLSDYLAFGEEQLYGKIPYIWLKDSQNELHRAAVPNVWVVSCQERLDFWSFLQEMGEVNAQPLSDDSKGKDTELSSQEKEQLIAEHANEIALIQEKAMGKAVQQLMTVLLEDEQVQLEPVAAIDPEDLKGVVPATNGQQVIEKTKEPEAHAEAEKPWVESENCTSCNDCIDKYPNLFKYNEDKQAFIEDPSKGSFEDLVKAAEKCPASCIHPGKPLNNAEPNLDKLIKRAEKFN